jgi:hypothetical protein
MFKKVLVITVLVAVIGVLVFGAVNRTLAQNGSESVHAGQGNYERGGSEAISAGQADESYTQGQANGGRGRSRETGGNGAGGNSIGSSEVGTLANLLPATPGELSADETAALLYMREEEKLAHDVYVTLYDQWNLPVFQNISYSEQTHTDAVKALIDRYGLVDPASSTTGVFTNPDLQKLYNDLVSRGSQSLADALKVGATIEEVDILDLETRLAQVDNADIQQVFNNLMNGSYNHLRAFVSTLNIQTGETYQPQYLSQEAYQAIVNGSTGNGNGGNSRGGNGQGSNGGGGGRRGSRP